MDLPRLRPYAGLLLAVLVAALLQTLLVVRSPSVTADGIIFTRIARELAAQPVETFRHHDQHPGFPAMMLAGTRLFQAFGYRSVPECWMAGGQAASFLCGLLSVGIVWLLARDLFDVRIANLAALIFAVLPVPRMSAADAMSDTPHMLLYTLAAWMIVRGLSHGGIWPFAAAGLASGLAYWIRPEGLEVAVVGLVCITGYGLYARLGVRRVALAGGALAAAALAVATPYMVLAGKFTSKQLPFAKAQPTTTYIALQSEVVETTAPATPADATAAAAPQISAADAAPVPSTSPTSVATPSLRSKRHSWLLATKVVSKAVAALVASVCQGFKWAFLPIYLLGNVELLRRGPRWAPVVFIALLAALHIMVLLSVFMFSGYIAHRHVLPLIALAMPFTALGVVYVGERLPRPRRFSTSFGALATMAACTAVVLPYTLTPFSREFVPVIEATKWVDAHAAPGAGVISNSPYVAFYGTLPTAYLGPESPTLDAAVERAHSSAHFDYVVLHVNAHSYQPQWISAISQNYRIVEEFPDPASPAKRPRKVVVFESKDHQARSVTSAPQS